MANSTVIIPTDLPNLTTGLVDTVPFMKDSDNVAYNHSSMSGFLMAANEFFNSSVEVSTKTSEALVWHLPGLKTFAR
jgi:hypothetical protein